MFDLWPEIYINFLIYANVEKLKRKICINLLNYFVNKYHHNLVIMDATVES